MSEKEPKLETKEDAVNFVMEVFRSMGGTVLPPKRPNHTTQEMVMTPERDAFMMDFENAIFETDYDQTEEIPKGPRRLENEKWAEAVKRNVYPHHSDVDWDEYCEWVSNGGGDEWFQEEI